MFFGEIIWGPGKLSVHMCSYIRTLKLEEKTTWASGWVVCTLSPVLCSPMDCSHQAPLSMESSVHGKNTEERCHFLLQRIFLTQGSSPCPMHLLHWQVDSFSTGKLWLGFMCILMYLPTCVGSWGKISHLIYFKLLASKFFVIVSAN